MRKKILGLFLFVFFFILVDSRDNNKNEENASKIYLLSHFWCRKCDKTVNIMTKIKSNLDHRSKQKNNPYPSTPKIQFQILQSQYDFGEERQIINKNTKKINESSEKQQKNNQGQEDSNNQDENWLFQNLIVTQKLIEQVKAKIQKKYSLKKSQIPYPTIWISCPNFQGIYQNQITYEQFEYWIGVYCYGKIPQCKPQNQKSSKQNNIKKEDYEYKISNVDFMHRHDRIIYFQIALPFVKFCIFDQNNKPVSDTNNYLPSFDEISKLGSIRQKSLFFSKFNHNVRNYLFNPSSHLTSKKVGVFLFFDNPLHPKVRQFIHLFKFLSDLSQKNKDYHLNQGKLFQLFFNNSSNQTHLKALQSQYHFNNLKQYLSQANFLQNIFKDYAFIAACYNSNKRNCVYNYEYEIIKRNENDDSQKPIIQKYQIPFSFLGTKIKNLKRLFEFAGLCNPFNSQNNQNNKKSSVKISAIHFNQDTQTIQGYEYQDVEAKLGNQFIFWLQNIHKQVFKGPKTKLFTKQNTQKRKCASNQLIHTMSERSLASIKSNINAKNYIQKINKRFSQQNKINFRTVIMQRSKNELVRQDKNWLRQNFGLCLKDKISLVIQQFEDIATKLEFSDLNIEKSKDNNVQEQKLQNEDSNSKDYKITEINNQQQSSISNQLSKFNNQL